MSDQFKDKVSRAIFTAYRDFYLGVNKIAESRYDSFADIMGDLKAEVKGAKDKIEAAASEAILEGLNDPDADAEKEGE